uniref:Putative toxin n=1 Tax=Pelinobius muticus TaxID=753628 RepID=D5J6Y2_PELMU|nr:putative toxin [Pelinobius muticus]
MNSILIAALLCVLAVEMTVSQPGTTDSTCRTEHAHLPKIPGCCEFLGAFRIEMDKLKEDPEESCKRFPDRQTQQECKMQKILTARAKIEPSPQCKDNMLAFMQGKPPSR